MDITGTSSSSSEASAQPPKSPTSADPLSVSFFAQGKKIHTKPGSYPLCCVLPTLLMGMANPMPSVLARTAVLTPTTSPNSFTRGPPLLPGLMAASVWMKLTLRSDKNPTSSLDRFMLRSAAVSERSKVDRCDLIERGALG